MKNSRMNALIASLVIGLVAFGCGQKTQSSSEAIELSKAKTTVEAQAQYLVQQANSFLSSEKFDEAVKTAQYVLSSLDANSTAARDIITKAEEELKKLAAQKLEEVKGKFGGLGQ